ncbi:hypothetical protein AB6A40_002740 [Gnathostoma spinigerum]|uniref:D-lactate dehydratase n=1 Tax=Gnathostoma spinigerum TaxID=75299 RepID=A0ABD6EF44_9BILA
MTGDKSSAFVQPRIPNFIKFAFGGCAGMAATCFTQPLDLLKNRMQVSGQNGRKEYRSSLHAVRSIIQKEGILELYNGLSAGLARQATYTTTRLGIYTYLLEHFSRGDKPPSFVMKASLGLIAGGCGAFVGTPCEVSLIRMTTDGRLPLKQRRNYKHIFEAVFKIYREEGLRALWRGCLPTIVRAMVVNACQLATYSQSKEQILQSRCLQDGLLCHFLASMASGLVTTTCSLPVDITKTSFAMGEKTAMVILAEGAEEMEAVISIDVLRRAGVKVTVAGLTGKDPVKCSRGTVVVPEKSLAEAKNSKYDVVVLPGGQPGSNSLAASDEVGGVLRAQHEAGRLIAAICAAPIALKTHNIAPGTLVTSHPCMKQKLVDGGYKYSEDRVVSVGNVVTSRGPGTAFEFALKLVERLCGTDKVKEISAPMIMH